MSRPTRDNMPIMHIQGREFISILDALEAAQKDVKILGDNVMGCRERIKVLEGEKIDSARREAVMKNTLRVLAWDLFGSDVAVQKAREALKRCEGIK